MKTYPLKDYYPTLKYKQCNLRGIYSGEFREPLKDEWYISGAIPECYQAYNNLTTKYHIANIVVVERIQCIADFKIVESGKRINRSQ